MEHNPLVQHPALRPTHALGTPPAPEPPRQVTAGQVIPGQVTAGLLTPGQVTSGQGASARRTPRLGIAAIAAAAFALEMAVSARYGYHRDELYFLAAGQHPAFGYVDQPPLTPLVARAEAVLFGNSLVGLRVLPALALSVLVLLTGAMSRILGATRAGQLIAALAAASCAEFLGAMHLLTTTTIDFVFWALVLYLVLRLLDSRDPRWWLAIGACAGIAAEAKWDIGFLVAALLAGFLATPARHLLRSRYLVIGAVLAAALAAPDVIWQAMHGWPNLDVFRVLQSQAGHNRALYWVAQVAFTGLALTVIWVAGLVWSLRSEAARPFRAVAIGTLAVLVLFFVLGGKPYYPGGAFTFLFAAGAVPAGRWLARIPSRRPRRWRPAALIGAMLVSAAAALPVAIPVMPAAALHKVPLQKINYDLAETIAWPRLVALVAREYHSLPPAQRAVTTIVADNYGEAGALDRYGRGFGLPQAYSGMNSFWFWGPPPAQDRSAIAVGMDPSFLKREFTSVRQVATFDNGLGVSNDEQGATIYLVSGLKSSWAQAWPAFKDFS
jgi:4-amino-4-deoxy-L-arabinose transferase-like glycosyltransferase